jgi:hypothetical protein
MKLTKAQALTKVHTLCDRRTPVLFSVALRGPLACANGHGIVTHVSDERISVEGRAGKLTLQLQDGFEYDLSGHYKLSEVQKIGLDLYFRNLERVRALTFNSEHGDAHLIFEVGADR